MVTATVSLPSLLHAGLLQGMIALRRHVCAEASGSTCKYTVLRDAGSTYYYECILLHEPCLQTAEKRVSTTSDVSPITLKNVGRFVNGVARIQVCRYEAPHKID